MYGQSNKSRVFYRSFAQPYPVATRAEGVYLTDSTGKQYLDASGGAAVCPVGHGNKRVVAAIKEQLETMAFAHTAFFTSTPSEELAARLSDKAPGGAWRSYFVSGGSEANEAALKLARQIQFERGETQRTRFISRRMSYHGSTIATMAIGTVRAADDLFAPLLPENVDKIMPCFAYRWQKADESDADFLARTSGALEASIEKMGDKRAICFIAETVSGATLGAVPPVPGYFKAIREICDRHGVLMILDEVMAGMGRCGTLFACEQDGVVPDMITLAKGLGGGYQPIGAVMVREELASEIEQGSKTFVHGHTYVGHASACAAGLAVQKVFEQDNLVEQVAQRGKMLEAKLNEAFGDHLHVGDLRGRGYFRGIELVKDRASKEPFDRTLGLAMKIKKAAMDEGLVCYPMGGTIDGKNGDHIMLAPPFIYEAAHMDEMTEKLLRAINTTIQSL